MFGFLRNVLHYAGVAWGFLAGISGDVGRALQHVWNFAASIHTLYDHIVSVVLRQLFTGHLGLTNAITGALQDIIDALGRINRWIFAHYVSPLRLWMIARIAGLRRWTQGQLSALRTLEITLYFDALRYAYRLVSQERLWRIADVQNARKYAYALVQAALAEIQKEAATGYAAGNKDRVSLVTKIADEIATRNPVLRALLNDLIGLLLDILAVDNPIARIALQFVLTRVVNKLGVDKVMGDLLSRLLSPLTRNVNPKNLHDVVKDLAERMTATEQQWADFMVNGGPEVEQAGREWKSYASIGTNVALLAFFGAAVADPEGWARDVSATVGAVVNATVEGTADLIGRG